MGWLRWLFLGDIGQQLDIADLERRIAVRATANRHAAQRDRAQDERIAELEQGVQELEAGLAALVGLLRQKSIMTEAELAAAIDRESREVERTATQQQEAQKAADEASRKALAEQKLQRVRRRKRS